MTAYTANFSPEAWVNDNAIPVDPEGPTEWDCTAGVATMPADYRREVLADEDGLDRYDWLKDDPDAPEWVRDWRGPFSIHVRPTDSPKEG